MDLEKYMLPCLSKTLFGFTCLGCGLQRSFLFLINGEFINAFKMYPAIFTLIILFLIIFLNFFLKIKKYKSIIEKLVYLNLLLIIVNYIIKF